MGHGSPGGEIAGRERGGGNSRGNDPGATERPNETEEIGHPFGVCSHCGGAFESGVRYPVTTERDPDGTLHLHSFCDATCQRNWRRARD